MKFQIERGMKVFCKYTKQYEIVKDYDWMKGEVFFEGRENPSSDLSVFASKVSYSKQVDAKITSLEREIRYLEKERTNVLRGN